MVATSGVVAVLCTLLLLSFGGGFLVTATLGLLVPLLITAVGMYRLRVHEMFLPSYLSRKLTRRLGCKVTVRAATCRAMSNGCIDRMVVVMYGVEIKNPSGFSFSTDTFAKIGMIEVLFDPWTVKSPCVKMNCVHIDDIDMYLERNKNGLMNTKGVKLSAKRAEERILQAQTTGEEVVSSEGEDDSDNEIIGDDDGDDFGMDFGGNPDKQSALGKATGRAMNVALAATASATHAAGVATAAAGPTVARMKDRVLNAVDKERKLLHGASHKIIEMAKGASKAASQLRSKSGAASTGTGASSSPGKEDSPEEGPMEQHESEHELSQAELKEQMAQLGINVEDYEKWEAMWASEDVVGPGVAQEEGELPKHAETSPAKEEAEDEFMDSLEHDEDEAGGHISSVANSTSASPLMLSRNGSKNSLDHQSPSQDHDRVASSEGGGSSGQFRKFGARLTGKLQDKAKAAAAAALGGVEKLKRKVAAGVGDAVHDDSSSVHSDEPARSQGQPVPGASAFRSMLRGGSFSGKSNPDVVLGSSPPLSVMDCGMSQPETPRSGSFDFQQSPEIEAIKLKPGSQERPSHMERVAVRRRSVSPEMPAAGSLRREGSGSNWLRGIAATSAQSGKESTSASKENSRGPSLEASHKPGSTLAVPTINGVVKSIQNKILTEARYVEKPGARFMAIDLATVRHLRVHFNKLVDTLRSPAAQDAKAEHKKDKAICSTPPSQADEEALSQRGSMESDRTEGGEPQLFRMEDEHKDQKDTKEEPSKQSDNGLNFDEPLSVDCVMVTSEELKASPYAVRKDGIPAGEVARRMKLRVRGELRKQNRARLLRLAGGVGMMWLRKKVKGSKPKPSQPLSHSEEQELRRRRLPGAEGLRAEGLRAEGLEAAVEG